jgi:hypothetical protein
MKLNSRVAKVNLRESGERLTKGFVIVGRRLTASLTFPGARPTFVIWRVSPAGTGSSSTRSQIAEIADSKRACASIILRTISTSPTDRPLENLVACSVDPPLLLGLVLALAGVSPLVAPACERRLHLSLRKFLLRWREEHEEDQVERRTGGRLRDKER